MKFYKCEKCGNIITYQNDSNVPVDCCGGSIVEMIPGTTDAAKEKHVPVVEVEGNKVIVKVGEVEHPMIEKHHISWVILETNKGYHKIKPEVDGKPIAEFLLTEGEKPVIAYEYCNLHGLFASAKQ